MVGNYRFNLAGAVHRTRYIHAFGGGLGEEIEDREGEKWEGRAGRRGGAPGRGGLVGEGERLGGEGEESRFCI